jgi:hypothetical protein
MLTYEQALFYQLTDSLEKRQPFKGQKDRRIDNRAGIKKISKNSTKFNHSRKAFPQSRYISPLQRKDHSCKLNGAAEK